MPAPDTAAETPSNDPATPAQDAPPATNGRRKMIGRIALGVAAVGVVYGIYAFIDYRNNGQYIQSTDDAIISKDLNGVITTAVGLKGFSR